MASSFGYSLPQFDIGLIKDKVDPQMLQALLALAGSDKMGPETDSLFSQYIPPELMAPNPMQAPAPFQAPVPAGPPAAAQMAPPAGGQSGIWEQFLAGAGSGLEKVGKTFTDPAAPGAGPFPRNANQTGLQNTAAGLANNTVNLPGNIWQLYSNFIGKPTADTVGPILGDLANWAMTPEAQVNAAKTAQEDATNPTKGFKPGLPPMGAGGGGSGPSLVAKITGVESGGNPQAKNPNSSAFGPGQFIKSTWMDFIKEAHPELVTGGKMGEAELLKLRSDPKLAEEATGWYAGKAVDVLDEINAPSTDANIYLHHFLGPEGVKNLLQADPTAAVKDVLDPKQIAANKTVLGGATSVQDVIDWAQAKMGDLTPQNPVDRPMQSAPDYSSMNNWLEQMRPKAMPEDTLKNLQLQTLLANIGNGLSSVNAEREGGGALFGALANGVTSGSARWHSLAAEQEEKFNQATAEYASGRAGIESTRAKEQADINNANAEASWMNSIDDQNWLAQQNEAKKAEEAALKAANQPKILSTTEKGIVYQMPDGSIYRESFDTKGQFDELEAISKVFGADTAQVRQMKYSSLAQQGTNPLTFQSEIIKDIVNDGQGPAVFGEAFGEALAAAEEQAPKGLAPGTPEYQEAINKIAIGLLLGSVNNSQNYDWILQAASLGNPGAMMMAQYGTKPE